MRGRARSGEKASELEWAEPSMSPNHTIRERYFVKVGILRSILCDANPTPVVGHVLRQLGTRVAFSRLGRDVC